VPRIQPFGTAQHQEGWASCLLGLVDSCPAGGPPCLVTTAELDDQPDYLSSDPEEQPHTSFRVVPARSTMLCGGHVASFCLSPGETYPPGCRGGDPARAQIGRHRGELANAPQARRLALVSLAARAQESWCSRCHTFRRAWTCAAVIPARLDRAARPAHYLRHHPGRARRRHPGPAPDKGNAYGSPCRYRNLYPRLPAAASRPGQLRLHLVVEAAELLGGYSDQHVYRLIAAGELRIVDIATPTGRSAGRPKIRIRGDDLAAYIERRTRDLSRPAGPVGRRV